MAASISPQCGHVFDAYQRYIFGMATDMARMQVEEDQAMTEDFYQDGLREPGLGDMLADPITRAMMRRDGVDESALRALMASQRESLLEQGRLLRAE